MVELANPSESAPLFWFPRMRCPTLSDTFIKKSRDVSRIPFLRGNAGSENPKTLIKSICSDECESQNVVSISQKSGQCSCKTSRVPSQ